MPADTMTASPPDKPMEKPPAKARSDLQRAGGSTGAEWNNTILNAVLDTIWTPRNSPEELKTKHNRAALAAMLAFKPTDEIEGMIAAQATAMHMASMECFRRAMIPEQPADMASRLRRDGANMARGVTDMVDALERKRGRASQQVRVEHVHVHDGGQAIVGSVTAAPGGGDNPSAGR